MERQEVEAFMLHITDSLNTMMGGKQLTVALCAGDFNRHSTEKFLTESPLHQLNDIPTKNNALLDLMFTSHPHYYSKVVNTTVSFSTDH